MDLFTIICIAVLAVLFVTLLAAAPPPSARDRGEEYRRWFLRRHGVGHRHGRG